MPASEGSVPPVVCTLTVGQRTDQELEWSDLADLALTSELIPGGVASTFPLGVAAEIDDLAARELSCCGSWLDITTTRLDDVIRLELTTENPDGVSTILSIAGHAPA